MIAKRITALIVLLFVIHFGYAQDKEEALRQHLSSQKGETTLGIGTGLSYGGLGVRFGSNIADELNLFFGVGYQIAGLGYNIGLVKDFKSSSMVQFYLTGMYGTNAAIKVTGAPEYNKMYTGATFGLGIKINSRMREGNYWNVGLLAPIRSSKFKDDEAAVQNDPRIIDFTSPWPVLIVVGYNFNL